MRPLLLCLALAAAPGALAAGSPLAEAQRAQMEALRGEVAAQLQLQAYDLVDELVYGWTREPVFALQTPVVLADVRAPVGFGSGLTALIENHLVGLLTKHPDTRIALVHCPSCSSWVVRSGAKGTIIAKGVDEPEALGQAGGSSGSRHALFLDFEVEGSSLVLRARLTALEPSLPIVYAKTLTTATSSPALLRTGDRLKSAAEAHQEYVDALAGRGVVLLPLRIGVRLYAADENQAVMVPPFIWLQGGVEAALTQARAWTGTFSLGLSWAPQLHTGWLAHAKVSRLLSGTATSLSRPDVYGFFGGSVISIHGPSALVFRDQVPSLENLIALAKNEDPHTTFAAFQTGLELRVKNRIGLIAYLETLPAMGNAPAIGNYVDLGFLQFQSIGVEVSFCF